MPYDSPIAVSAQPTQAVAVYCSDGRFVRHTLDFLQHRHGLDLVDALAVPGGPARLLAATDTAVLDDVAFLIEAHGLRRAVLIQHEDCGHYGRRLGLRDADATRRQDEDLAAAGRVLRRRTGIERIDLYTLRLHGDEVRFEPLALPATPA